jgi:glycosyltransferase involved in cell wall biosynthesis
VSVAAVPLASSEGRTRALGLFAWRAGVLAFAAVGWTLAIRTLVVEWSQSGFDAHTYWAAGRAILAGASPYTGAYGGPEGFRYAPPLAVLFAVPAILPFELFRVPMLALNVLALRYVAGSWRWAGVALLYPWTVNELYVGNVNLPMAVALFAAFRRSTALLALAALAKISPLLAIPELMRRGRSLAPFAATLVLAVGITLPMLFLWPAWASALATTGTPGGAIQIPFLPRLALAVVLATAAWQRRLDWLAALAVIVALPVLWPSSLVMLIAPIRLLIEGDEPVSASPAGSGAPAGIAATTGTAVTTAASRDARSAGVTGRSASLGIVLPAYNEAARIGPALDELFGYLRRGGPAREGGVSSEELGQEWSVLVVDDGSTDDTGDLVRAHREAQGPTPRLRVLGVPHGGKGAAVRVGMLATDADVIVFADADMATPPDQLPLLTRALATSDVALGSRIQPDGSDRRAGQPVYRRLLGRLFHALAAAWVTGPVPDTQCGFKGFRREAAHDLFGRQRIDSIVFDAEIIHLARRRGYRIVVVPVEWSDRRGSRMRPGILLGLRVAWDLFRIPLLHRTVRPHVGALADDTVRGVAAPGG